MVLVLVEALHRIRGIERKGQHVLDPALVGFFERFFYTAALQMTHAPFIAVWLALKVVPQWKQWTAQSTTIGRVEVYGREAYNMFLIGNAASLLYGVAGFKFIDWSSAGKWALAWWSVAGLVVVTNLMCLIIWRTTPKIKKD